MTSDTEDSKRKAKKSFNILPGVEATPLLTLHRVLEDVDRIKNVSVCVRYDDGSMEIFHNPQPAGEILCASALLHGKALSAIKR